MSGRPVSPAIRGTSAVLPQAPVPGGLGLEPTGFSHVLSGRGLDVLDDALEKARTRMADHPTAEHIALFSDLEEQFRENGGYEVEGTLARLAAGLGLPEGVLFEDIDQLSGGQRRRVDLMRILFESPDTIILDEPTNHLDLRAKAWLMDELAGYRGAILVVSHDLRLLDRSIDKVLYLSGGLLHEYKGTYSAFTVALEVDRNRRERSAALEAKEVKRLSTLADSMRNSTERRARTAKALDRRVQRLSASRTEVLGRERDSRFRLPVPVRSGAVPLRVEHLSVRYGPTTVLRDLDFHLGRGDRMVVVGRNGAGKSSLLRCLAGVQQPDEGTIALGANVSIGYFAQEHEQIDFGISVLENIDDTVLATESERRALLGSFGLTGKAAYQRPATLSGGERAKLSLAMLSAGRANLLLLDEPTNNLDPTSIEAVGKMLAQWPGTVVVVSHERRFVEELRPTQSLVLPAEVFDYWDDELLDEVEIRVATA